MAAKDLLRPKIRLCSVLSLIACNPRHQNESKVNKPAAQAAGAHPFR